MGKVTAVTSQTGAYKLRQFTEPISRHVTSTVQKLIKGMQRTGLNRHRRGYVTKERVQRHVPFLVPGPIGLARSQFLNFILSSSLSSSLFSSHNRYHYFKSYITTGTIALTKAVVPIHTSLFGISRNLDEQVLLMQLVINQLL